MVGIEIERKWNPSSVPDWVGMYPHKEYRQGYLCTDPVVRVRSEGDDYVLTYKGKGGIERIEYNLPLTGQAFEKLLGKCDGIIIEKTRYRVPLSEESDNSGHGEGLVSADTDPETLIAEVDLFHGCYEGRIYVEVEFPSRKAAEEFKPPFWFGPEVTGKPGYSNADLSRGTAADI